ncbi:hypothetical protein BTJ40_06160 [Microbulbifer sp. A4B17]|uniref:right-handed parallel beta-helix repeat-containing protein n=1 Tax=Microbulbifer sp. A4B17 TaxID=359370 RepID=UPI000D52E283|nr:right-handed parallel beta-helix repeat-containing protein [Microbulbifer sp. A4B17]AWF80427.1 hypothetical protein BTJ40_06160 [Microbulbifer sp. A4B17]
MKKSYILALTISTMPFSHLTEAVDCGDIITTAEILDNDITSCTLNPVLTIVGPTGSLNLNDFNVNCTGQGAGISLDGTAASLIGGTGGAGTNTVGGCGTAISVEGAGLHNIQGVNATNSIFEGVGIYSNNNFIIDINSSGNSGNGMEIFENGNQIIGATIENNGQNGIIVEGSETFISQTQSSLNSLFGIRIRNSNNSYFIQNTTNSNNSAGIVVESLGQTGNFIIGNTAFGNPDFDADDQNTPPCIGTQWQGNNFGTSGDSCID